MKMNQLQKYLLIFNLFFLSTYIGYPQNIYWDSLIVSKNKKDSLKILRNNLNHFGYYWKTDSNANNGFRELYSKEIYYLVPKKCLPINFIVHYFGKPDETLEMDKEFGIYKFLIFKHGENLNEIYNYHSYLCFSVNNKTKLIEKLYFTHEGE